MGTKCPHALGQLNAGPVTESASVATKEAHVLQLLSPCTLEAVLCNERSQSHNKGLVKPTF